VSTNPTDADMDPELLSDGRYPKLSEKIHSERDYLRCKSDWTAHAVALEKDVAKLRTELATAKAERDELRRQLTFQSANNHKRNVELDALHYVWCDGGCKTGIHRYDDAKVTQELVDLAIRNTARLVAWWRNNRGRAGERQEWAMALLDQVIAAERRGWEACREAVLGLLEPNEHGKITFPHVRLSDRIRALEPPATGAAPAIGQQRMSEIATWDVAADDDTFSLPSRPAGAAPAKKAP
jgi:hypothetical protein